MIERTHRSHGPRGVQISPRTSKAWLRAVYAATKAAVEAMTGILAKELRGRNITVNAIAPGPTATKLFLDGKPPEAGVRAPHWHSRHAEARQEHPRQRYRARAAVDQSLPRRQAAGGDRAPLQ